MAKKVTVEVWNSERDTWGFIASLTREDADRFIAQAKISLGMRYRIKEDA